MSDDQDWRLTVELDAVAADRHGVLEGLREHARASQVVRDARPTLPHDVVLTHDGERLFVYAASRETLSSARSAIEGVIAGEGIGARLSVSHWEQELDTWKQIDPPLTGEQAQAEQAAERDAEALETRTLVASSGRLIRAEFERTMSTYAEQLGVECKIVEHPHLLSTQVAFTVTGPRRKVQELADGLKAEEWATIRTETGVMLSPL